MLVAAALVVICSLHISASGLVIELTPRANPRRQLYQRDAQTTYHHNVSMDPYTNQTDLQWYGLVGFGTPPQYLSVIFDTGGQSPVIKSINCSLNCNPKVKKFNASASSSIVSLNARFDIEYSTGSDNQNFYYNSPPGMYPLEVLGQRFNDTVTLAGYTIPNTTMKLVDAQGSGFAADPFDGIFGMPDLQPYNEGGSTQYTYIFDKLYPTAPKQFSYYVKPHSKGQITFGGSYDKSLYEGELTWLPNYYDPVYGYGLWQPNITSLYVNNVHLNNDVPIAGIDTGTSNIYAPRHIVDAIYKQFPQVKPYLDPNYGNYTGMYQFPCNQAPKTFNLTFNFGGRNFTVPTEEFNLGHFPTSNDTTICQAILNAMQDDQTYWIIGNSFLKHNFAVFDWGKHMIGLAPHAEQC